MNKLIQGKRVVVVYPKCLLEKYSIEELNETRSYFQKKIKKIKEKNQLEQKLTQENENIPKVKKKKLH